MTKRDTASGGRKARREPTTDEASGDEDAEAPRASPADPRWPAVDEGAWEGARSGGEAFDIVDADESAGRGDWWRRRRRRRQRRSRR